MIAVWAILACVVYFVGVLLILSLAIAAKKGDRRG